MKSNLLQFHAFKKSYDQYVSNYMQFLKLRGFGTHVNDWYFVKRGFLTCWLQPGFHRFWQTWNPGIAYFAYKVYLSCGGKNRQKTGTIAAFLVNGLIHNLFFSLVFWRWDFPLPFTFTMFGIFTVFFRWMDDHLKMERWPKVFHLCINLGLIILSFDIGFRMNNLLHTIMRF